MNDLRAVGAVTDVTGIDLERHPEAIRVIKHPEPVEVEFAPRDGVLQTLEGFVRYKAGDALVTGPSGERWPIQAGRFARTYRPAEVFQANAAQRFVKHPRKVLALRMSRPFRIRTPGASDPLSGKAGDWLVQYSPGEHGIVDAEIFSRTYETTSD